MENAWTQVQVYYVVEGLYDAAGDVDRLLSQTRPILAAIEHIRSDFVNLHFHGVVAPKNKLQIADKVRDLVGQYKRFKEFIGRDGVEYDVTKNEVTINSVLYMEDDFFNNDEELDFWAGGLEHYQTLENVVDQNGVGMVNFEEVIEEIFRAGLPNGVMDVVGPPFIHVFEFFVN